METNELTSLVARVRKEIRKEIDSETEEFRKHKKLDNYVGAMRNQLRIDGLVVGLRCVEKALSQNPRTAHLQEEY